MLIAGRRARSVLPLALALLTLGGCRWRAPTPAGRYEKDGLGFEYLAGWTVKKDTQKHARIVVVEGPHHAVLTVSVFAANVDISLETFANDVAERRGENVKKRLTVAGVNLGAEGESTPLTPTERSIAGTKTRGVEQQTVLKVVGVPIPHTMQHFITHMGGRTIVLMDQVADEERSKVNAGIQKIFDTISFGP